MGVVAAQRAAILHLPRRQVRPRRLDFGARNSLGSALPVIVGRPVQRFGAGSGMTHSNWIRKPQENWAVGGAGCAIAHTQDANVGGTIVKT